VSGVDTAQASPKSCYVLEFSVRPGGARLGDVHVYGTLAEQVEAARSSNRFRLGDDYQLLRLDWKAIEADLPPLSGPVLTTGDVTIAWPEGMSPQPEGCLRLAFNADGVAELHAGVNDLELGEDDYPENA
jgi:hypothetical protein